MKRKIGFFIGLIFIVLSGACVMVTGEESGGTAGEKLQAGNKRFVEAKLLHPNQTPQRRAELAKGQQPFAAIVCCSDSRVPVEVIFDQGLGDLFVIRLAGNIVDEAALASLEYAVAVLGVKYIMVLGHSNCGAVNAALQGGEVPGHIGCLVKAIQPAVVQSKNQPGNPLDNAIKANVNMVVKQLKSSKPILEPAVKKGDLTVIGACYDLASGKVEKN